MKKLMYVCAAMAAAISLVMFSGCNYFPQDTDSDTSNVSENQQSPDLADSGLGDFVKYMEEGGFIKGKGEELTASAVGAARGERYTISSPASSAKVYVELYEYADTNSELALKILGEAKNKGTFALYKDISTEKTAAAVSADGKYLMLYTDSSNSGSSVQTKNDALIAVSEYGK